MKKRIFISFLVSPFVLIAQNNGNQQQTTANDFKAIYLINSNAIEIQGDFIDINIQTTNTTNDNVVPQKQELNILNPNTLVTSNYTQPNAPRSGYTGGSTGGGFSSANSKKTSGFSLKKKAIKVQKKLRKIFHPSNKKKKTKNKCFSW